MAHPISLLAATPSSVSPAGTDWGGDLPADLTALGLEALMALRVGGRARQDPDPDDAPETRERTPVLAGVTGAAQGAGANVRDLPADLTALSLAQLMNVPVRAPEPEDEEEPEVAGKYFNCVCVFVCWVRGRRLIIGNSVRRSLAG